MLEVALDIPFWLELAATLSGAIFGAMSAMRAQYDLFGTCCIAIVVGLAGGMLRDVLLQNYGIYAFQNPNLIIGCIVAGVVVFYFGKLVTYFDPAIDLLDNVSVALWAVIGTGKAMSAGLDLVPAVILGTMTANGGGIMRDICMNREPEAFKAGTLYVTAALVGCIAYYLIKQSHIIDAYAGIIGVFVVLAVRYAAIAFGWRTRPPRDYSDTVMAPVRSVARRVAPLRGRNESGKAPRHSTHTRVFGKKTSGNAAAGANAASNAADQAKQASKVEIPPTPESES
jgi:uncharacterized membrane protein YeiH